MDPDSQSEPAVITSIRAVARARHRLVALSDGRQLVVSDEAIDRLGLIEGTPATEELFASLEQADQGAAAHDAALRLLASKSRSEREMRLRLMMRGFEPAVIDSEVERLQRAGLLDDSKFARAWVANRQTNGPRGKRMIRYELLGHGIDPEAAEAVTRDLDDRGVAFELARKRARTTPTDDYDRFLARVGGFLRRRGFEYALAAEATRQAWEELQTASDEGASA